MIRDQGLQLWPSSPQFGGGSTLELPVLIEVPRIRTWQHPTHAASRWRVPRRRRLRRRVRIAGLALLFASPVALVLTGLPAVRHALWATSMRATTRLDDEPRQRPPVISISVEPLGTLPHAGTEVDLPPVV